MTQGYGIRPTRAEISLENLLWNFEQARGLVGDDVAIAAVVKANAYGHGAIPVARALVDAGASWLAVALPEEGAALREAGLRVPILCMGGFWAGQEAMLLDFELTPEVYRVDMLESLEAEASRRGISAPVHLKVDTGMGRLGVPLPDFEVFVDRVSAMGHIAVDGLMTHLSSSDVPELGDFTRGQIAKFFSALVLLETKGISPKWRHLANGAGLHAYPEARGNMVRPGALLYGLADDVLNPEAPEIELRPVMRFVSRVEHLKTVPAGTPLGYACSFATSRESVIATIPGGYADGVRRALSNRGSVAVGGRRAPIVGRVSMDFTIVDVTDLDGVKLGDEVVFFGGSGISVEEVAADADTISYEITCGVSSRVPRSFK